MSRRRTSHASCKAPFMYTVEGNLDEVEIEREEMLLRIAAFSEVLVLRRPDA